MTFVQKLADQTRTIKIYGLQKTIVKKKRMKERRSRADDSNEPAETAKGSGSELTLERLAERNLSESNKITRDHKVM